VTREEAAANMGRKVRVNLPDGTTETAMLYSGGTTGRIQVQVMWDDPLRTPRISTVWPADMELL
jgi:hypothetical protein